MKLLVKNNSFATGGRKELFDDCMILVELDKFGLAVFKHCIIFETAGFD